MSEPFGMFGDPAELGLASPWAAVVAMRADARERAAEQRERAERAERAEDRRERAMFHLFQQAVLEGRQGVDPTQPATFVPTPDELGERVFQQMDAEARRAEFRAKIESGELHLLDGGLGPAAPQPAPGSAAAIHAEREEGERAARSRAAEVHNMQGRIRRQRAERVGRVR